MDEDVLRQLTALDDGISRWAQIATMPPATNEARSPTVAHVDTEP